MQCVTVLVAVIATSSLILESVSGRPSVDVKAVDVKSLLQSLKALQQDTQQDKYGSLNNQYNVQPYSKKQTVGNRQQYYEKYAKQKKQRYDDRPSLFDDQVYERDDDRDEDEVVKVLEKKPYRQNGDRKQKLFNQKALESLFGANNRAGHQKHVSSLLGPNEEALDLDKYSRIYVVLNPQALKQDKDVADLVSQVARGGAEDDVRQYNGFAVDSQLLRRASDLLDEPVGKRPRGREGGGGYGGGAGGRTAIPYLKHRGDIYERDE